ncbi:MULTISPECIES: hypothetical protein [unclassified Pantoea]|uniref:hypothetical protein n=1 Tax=unclassified Pantoea TaxID=2630326 RepID=UPI001CD752DF|nr:MULTISPECIES: hypothetical protein [unclassified Pantoea]MCA1178345.1 hypothetical protein [Pantoea sp. alder69]MCA1253182.1 hypothetical protein [Pantoea sp. alder70]MCA1266559.1 hypothetical protein [Pantoea sp. alder81]
MNTKKLLKALVSYKTISLFIPTILALYFGFHPFSPSNEKTGFLIGQWQYDYNYINEGMTVKVTGNTTYFKNGKYNSIANMTLQSEKSFDITCHLNVAGFWDEFDEDITTTTQDLVLSTNSLKLNGSEVGGYDICNGGNKATTGKSTLVAVGQSQSYRKISASKDEVILLAHSSVGDDYKIYMKKIK